MKIDASTIAAIFIVLSRKSIDAANHPFAPKVSHNTPESSYIGSILKGAVPTARSRRLDQEDIDISGYSLKFEKCQFIKQYAEERNEDIDSVLETKRFVIFRLCPNNSCSDCSEDYGEYIVDLESYLEATINYKQEEQENYCQACDECQNEEAAGNDDDDAGARRLAENVDCDTCYNKCQNIENMEENGYADAAEYTNCEKVYENDNTGLVYYAGPICANSGSRIKVGLFMDEECDVLDESAEIDKYIKNDNGYNVKLSYHLLKQTFVADDCVASCTVENEDDDGNGEVETAEVCENLYEASGKCENPHGFVGMDYSNSEYYSVQKANEENVCGFISNIKSDLYDESGEVVIKGGVMSSSKAPPTGLQKFFLTFFVVGTIGLAAYATLLHQKITKGAKTDLLEGGAMA